VPDEVADVLTRYRTEGAIEALLDHLGCEYRLQPEDGGYRGWLTEIARRVAAGTSA
jgi:hypothetical protein